MPSVEVIRVRQAIQYTGGNGPEVSAFAGSGIVSDNGSVLQLGDPLTNWVAYTLNVGDWYESTDAVPWEGASFSARHITKAAALLDTNTVFDPTALNAQVAANTSAISALQGKLGKADIVSISVPILILGGTADRPITWNRPFSNASYDLSFAFDASTIGRITCSVVAGTKTTTGVTIRITAGLAVSVLGVVHVFGIGV